VAFRQHAEANLTRTLATSASERYGSQSVRFADDAVIGRPRRQTENTTVVTRYQMRLSVYHLAVVIAALVAASPRLTAWIVRGRPREYVPVEIDGTQHLVDARVWPDHPLNPKNRIEPDRLIQTGRGPENDPISSRAAPAGDDPGDLRRVSAVQ
jgi:hypothetical protein